MDENTPTIKRFARDDWSFIFTQTDANNSPIDLTGRGYEGVLFNPVTNTETVIGMSNGASILDQTKPETRGKFKIRVTSDITKDLVYVSPIQSNVTISVKTRELVVKLRIVEINNGDRQTFGSILILVEKA